MVQKPPNVFVTTTENDSTPDPKASNSSKIYSIVSVNSRRESISSLTLDTSKTEAQNVQVHTGPPPLPFNIRDHVGMIIVFWFFILAECCFIPISFYYGIGNSVHIREGMLFAIITSVFGFVSGVEYTLRGYRLLKVSDEFRPLNDAKRFWGFDATQWVLLQPYGAMTGILVGFSIPDPPLVKGLALPMPVGMIMLGFIFGWTGVAHRQGWKLKWFRLSSHPIGSVCPPLTLCVLEDVVAVDASGGKKFREAVLARYRASPLFERLMVHLLWFWSIPAIILGAAFIVVIYNVPEQIGYGIGWAGPCVWACTWVFFSFVITRRALRDEERSWKSVIPGRA